jgi:hypothetical protein
MPWSTPILAPRRSWNPAPWLAAAASIALTVVAWGAATADPCPSSVVHFEKYELAGTFYVSALMYDSTFTPDPYEVVHIMFDRTQATTSLIASSVSRMAASSRVVEAFDVVGVPPGTPVNGTLELRLDGWSEQNCGGSGCGVRLEGWLLSGMDSTEADANQFGPNLGRRFVATTLALPVTFVAGSPIEAHFFLTFDNGPGGGAQVEIQARYAVSGLPAGVQAVACQDVTPTRRDTWGRLKSSYR